MKRTAVFRSARHIAWAFAAIQVLAVTTFPTAASAGFKVPGCKTLADLGLDATTYKDDRLEKVFGASIYTWGNAEVKAFVKGFTDCRQQLPPNMRFNLNVSVSWAANDIVRRINAHHKRQARAKSKPAISPRVEALLTKYPDLAPGRDFLSATFRTYAGAGSTRDIGTVIEFYDKITGHKAWQKVNDVWVLVSDNISAETGNNINTRFVFVDQRPREPYVWLDSVTVDGRTQLRSVVTYWVRELFMH